jgi:hypothetical protein
MPGDAQGTMISGCGTKPLHWVTEQSFLAAS